MTLHHYNITLHNYNKTLHHYDMTLHHYNMALHHYNITSNHYNITLHRYNMTLHPYITFKKHQTTILMHNIELHKGNISSVTTSYNVNFYRGPCWREEIVEFSPNMTLDHAFVPSGSMPKKTSLQLGHKLCTTLDEKFLSALFLP